MNEEIEKQKEQFTEKMNSKIDKWMDDGKNHLDNSLLFLVCMAGFIALGIIAGNKGDTRFMVIFDILWFVSLVLNIHFNMKATRLFSKARGYLDCIEDLYEIRKFIKKNDTIKS